MAEVCKIWAKKKKTLGQTTPDKEKLIQSQNQFYCVVRKAKRECWQNFLKNEKKNQDTAKIRPEDKN